MIQQAYFWEFFLKKLMHFGRRVHGINIEFGAFPKYSMTQAIKLT